LGAETFPRVGCRAPAKIFSSVLFPAPFLPSLSEKFYSIDATNYEEDVEKALLGLGFTRGDFQRQTSDFSGGWRMRIELAKLLLQKPDVLLLDEPTNHLDIESIQWLEDFLINNGKAVIVISHDRKFVDNITTRTIEVTMGRIYDYKVNYSLVASIE